MRILTFLTFIPILIYYSLKQIVYYFAKNKPKVALAFFRGIVRFFMDLKIFMNDRAIAQKSRKVSEHKILCKMFQSYECWIHDRKFYKNKIKKAIRGT
jgi:hypothetical protein